MQDDLHTYIIMRLISQSEQVVSNRVVMDMMCLVTINNKRKKYRFSIR